jgi:uncharacterized RDD family membrane protein YckC
VKLVSQPVCGNCGADVSIDSNQCSGCGAAVQIEHIYRFGTWWERAIATAIDVLVFVMVTAAVPRLLVNAGYTQQRADLVGGVLLVAGLFIYFVVMDATTGKTLGRMVFGLLVLTKEETRTGIGRSIVRDILKILGIGGYFPVTLGCILWSKRSQRIGDMLAGTIVVKDVTERVRGERGLRSQTTLLND